MQCPASCSCDSQGLIRLASSSAAVAPLCPMAAPSRSQVLLLFRDLLRAASKFKDYNIREYTRRRAAHAFRHNRSLSDPSAISSAFADGEAQLEVARRQAVVYELYAPAAKSVMEIGHAKV